MIPETESQRDAGPQTEMLHGLDGSKPAETVQGEPEAKPPPPVRSADPDRSPVEEAPNEAAHSELEAKPSPPPANSDGSDRSPVEEASEEAAHPELEPTPRQSFDRFRTWLEGQGPRYQVWAHDCIFIGVRPPVLELEFPEGFRHSHVAASDRDEHLLVGLSEFFPACNQIQVRNRKEDSTRLTHREAQAKSAHEAQQALEAAVADHADIQTLVTHFDAAIRSVHKDYRAPMPPVLTGDDQP